MHALHRDYYHLANPGTKMDVCWKARGWRSGRFQWLIPIYLVTKKLEATPIFFLKLSSNSTHNKNEAEGTGEYIARLRSVWYDSSTL